MRIREPRERRLRRPRSSDGRRCRRLRFRFSRLNDLRAPHESSSARRTVAKQIALALDRERPGEVWIHVHASKTDHSGAVC